VLATKTQQQQRLLTVCASCYGYQSGQHLKQKSEISQILLKGKWLAQAGFHAGQQVTVTLMPNGLIITKNKNSD
jgi:hypothetical protein